MTKKARRVRKAKPKSAVSQSAAKEAVSQVSKTRSGSAEQFKVEYAYVVKDLRRVFVLAGLMFILLIALNLILQ